MISPASVAVWFWLSLAFLLFTLWIWKKRIDPVQKNKTKRGYIHEQSKQSTFSVSEGQRKPRTERRRPSAVRRRSEWATRAGRRRRGEKSRSGGKQDDDIVQSGILHACYTYICAYHELVCMLQTQGTGSPTGWVSKHQRDSGSIKCQPGVQGTRIFVVNQNLHVCVGEINWAAYNIRFLA